MLSIRDLQAGYGKKAVVKITALNIDKGKTCLLRGPSGSGKTRLLYAMAGLGEIMAGQVTVAGTDIYRLDESARDDFRGSHIGIVFQTLHLVKSLSVVDNILLGAFAAGRAQDIEWGHELTARLGIDDIIHSPVTDISQGQAQRVAIARALINKPQLLIADEPTSSLDEKGAMQWW